LATGQLKVSARIHTIGKTIARLKTVARDREIEQSMANQ
ncbi:50S ribosomal protein L29, partial [Escherichia coli]|nr:50S ribosomal protein L29 [Escherichia coli]